MCYLGWGVFILILVLVGTGFWPLISYTMTSWNLLWIRMFLTAVGDTKFMRIARYFKFPALAGCTITVAVWWSILVPLIHFLMNDKKKQHEFWTFNTSFLLLNIHLMNLPIAAAEFYLSSSRLVFFDLWMGLMVSFIYIMFYLGALDSRGIHLYIILTPRTHFCILSYSLILFLYYACYNGWNLTID